MMNECCIRAINDKLKRQFKIYVHILKKYQFKKFQIFLLHSKQNHLTAVIFKDVTYNIMLP